MSDVDGLSPDRLLMRAVDSIGTATSLQDAVQGIVSVLQGPFELWHANVAILRTGSSTGEVLATWSMAESVIVPGTQVSITITETLSNAVTALARGEVAILDHDPRSGSLIDYIAGEEGGVSTVMIPLQDDTGALVVLSLSSSSPILIKETPRSFFKGLGAGVGPRLTELARSRQT